MKKLIIEVAQNEIVTRDENPHVPLTAEEIAEDAYQCYLAGASIVHFHNRKTDWQVKEGLSADDPSRDYAGKYDTMLAGSTPHYVETMKLMKARCDVIPYPTFPPPGNKARDKGDLDRFSHVRELREHPDVRLETFVCFVGAANVGRYDKATDSFILDMVSSTTHADMVNFLRWCKSANFRTQFAVREPGHMRHILMYRDMGLVPDPIVVHLNFSDATPHGPLPNAEGIAAFLSVVPHNVRCEWFIHSYTTFGHDPSIPDTHRLLNVLAVAMGGHVRTGIGDLPRWDGKALTNAQMVAAFVEVARIAGREIATPAEARQILGLT